MNRNMYWLLLATTTFTPSTKVILDKKMKALGIKAPAYNLASVAADAVSEDEEVKAAAIAKLNDTGAFWYVKPDVEVCTQIKKNLGKLRGKDFLNIHGALNAVAKVNFVVWDEGADFHIDWVLDRKGAEALNAEEA